MRCIPKGIARTALAVALSTAACVSAADKQQKLNAKLHGSYAFTQTLDCVEVGGALSFDPVTFQIVPLAPPPGTFTMRRVNGIARGVNTYNGDGTGTASLVATTIDPASGIGSVPVTQSLATCKIAYTVKEDDSVDFTTQCENTVNGAVVATSGDAKSTGWIGQGRRTIVVGPTEPPLVETITFSPPNAFPNRQRVCMRSFVNVRMAEH